MYTLLVNGMVYFMTIMFSRIDIRKLFFFLMFNLIIIIRLYIMNNKYLEFHFMHVPTNI